MDLDLGEKASLKVKVGEESYKVAIPTVKQAINFKKELDGNEGQEAQVFIDLLSKLGMPKEIAEDLSLSQMSKLADALMGASKKN